MNKIFRILKPLLIILVFTFYTNANASTSSSSMIHIEQGSMKNISTTTIGISLNMYSLTWGHSKWKKFLEWLKNAICSKCGTKCGGSCGPNGGGTPPGGGTSIPLDGGLSILALGAAAFGIRKLRNTKNGKQH
ncbi:PID-CTERM protein-sorting domain-containing protein [Cognatitamlana onchidii]|uniref:PID-CTERM protein-sorting domain-containing protein n=1 Tax=Cognatitamlana onchidii TaxID=2562860 RepID=UPI0010A5FFFB|nr:hypothetical protein [Algibacter onchidii]